MSPSPDSFQPDSLSLSSFVYPVWTFMGSQKSKNMKNENTGEAFQFYFFIISLQNLHLLQLSFSSPPLSFLLCKFWGVVK